MRVLVTARLLWPQAGWLPLEALPGLVDASPEKVALAVNRLGDERVVELAPDDHSVRLSDHAAGEILRPRCGEPVIRWNA
jgi:hypothetical protein